MNYQLSLDGKARPLPLPQPKRLTWRQRQLVEYLHTYGPVAATSVRTHTNPWGALRRLERLGLAARDADGRWRAR